jgi:hypothetical protein
MIIVRRFIVRKGWGVFPDFEGDLLKLSHRLADILTGSDEAA